MTPSREAIEAAARALCPMPFDGERKNQCWEDYAAEAEAALTAALPLLAEVNVERDSARALLTEAAVFVENAATSEQFRIDYKDHYGDHEGVAIALLARIAAALRRAE